MCGIAGILSFDPERPVDEAVLRNMCAALSHRGPDDQGMWVNGRVGLGHRRLSIIDLSPAGHQPMGNEDGSVWITFNGEIYNFLELRRDLERDGWRFRSRTDTEVLLRLYEARGVDALQAAHGMFAFAIWDARRRQLLLARDRLGKKPLYYRRGPHGLAFASELKALLRDPGIERRVNPVAIDHYLAFQYVPSPLCAFQGVQKLPPGHRLVWRDGAIDVQRYWRLSFEPKIEVRDARQQAALEAELIDRLDEAVRARLVSDVPLGAFLSGGIDSSAVVALMSRHGGRPVKTFSIGFDEVSYDELPAARAVADHFRTDHTEYRVRPDMLELVPALVRAYDEPYADASAIPTFLISRLARREVTVVLTGDGGDENFAGYDRYVANDLAHRLRGVAPLLGSRAMRSVLGILPHGDGPRDLRWRLKRFTDQLARPPEERNTGWLSQFDRAEKEQLYVPEFRRQVDGRDSRALMRERYDEAGTGAFLDAVLYADILTYLPDCLLVKTDIATMAHGLEARCPFLDHTFMEFTARIPASLKLRRGETKRVLKRALRGVVPTGILRRPKMGFNMPLDLWLRGPLREPAHELLLGPRARARGYFRTPFVEQILREHYRGRWSWHNEIWTLMMLELWHREMVDGTPAANDAAVLAGPALRDGARDASVHDPRPAAEPFHATEARISP